MVFEVVSREIMCHKCPIASYCSLPKVDESPYLYVRIDRRKDCPLLKLLKEKV